MKKIKTLILSALAVLFLCLGVSGQTDLSKRPIKLNPCVFPMDQDNFNNAAAWTKVDPITNGNGSIVVGGGSLTFSNADAPACPSVLGACDNRDLRIYRALSGILSNSWRAEVKFRITNGNGIDHTLLAFTAGNQDPQGTNGGAWGTCPGSVGSGFAQDYIDGIMASIIAFGNDQNASSTNDQIFPGSYSASVVPGAGTKLGWRIFGHAKCGAKILAGTETFYPLTSQVYPAEIVTSPAPPLNWSRGILLPHENTDYYLRLERLDNGNCVISIFSDAAMTINIPGSPQCFQIDPAITGLNTVQNAVSPSGGYYRSAAGYIQNFAVYNNCPGLPDLNLTASNDTVCASTGVTLTASAGFTNYTWYPGPISTGSGNTLVVHPTVTTTYTVSAGYPGYTGCPLEATIKIVVTPTPVAPVATSNSAICAGSTLNLFASTITGATYSWTGPNSFSSTLQNPTIVNAATSAAGTYSVTASIGACSSPVATTVVVIHPAPSVCMSGPVTICEGNCTTISGSCGPVKGITYSWSPTTGLSTPHSATTLACPTATTTYTLTATNVFGCTTTGTVTVTVYPTPVITVTPPSASICAGSSVTLTASGGIGYTWSPATSLSASTGATVIATPSVTTTYTVTGHNKLCSSETTVTITVKQGPSVCMNTPALICSGNCTTISGSCGIAFGDTYSWLPTTGLSSPNAVTTTACPTSSTTYTLTVHNTFSGCSSQGTTSITVSPTPTITVTPPSANICVGSNVTLTASGGSIYTWSPAATLSVSSGPTVVATPTVSTTYTVIGGNRICRSKDSVTVTVSSGPPVCMSGPVTICEGNCTTISGICKPIPGVTYSWSPTTGLSTPTLGTTTACPIVTTTYTLTATNSFGCTSTGTVMITVLPSPAITVTPASSTICVGNSVTLTASGGGAYTWTPATGLSATTGASVVATPTTTTVYTVTGSNKRCSAQATATVTVTPGPPICMSSPVTICKGSCTTISGICKPIPGLTYSWSPTTGLSTPTLGTTTACPTVTTTYTLIATNSFGCTSTGTVTVTVAPTPAITVTPTSASVCAGSSVTLTASGAGAYSWSPSATLNVSTGSTVIATPIVTTTYTVSGNNKVCTSVDSVTITVNPRPPLCLDSVYVTCPKFCDTLRGACAVTLPGTIYHWSPATHLSDTNKANTIECSLTTTTYTLTATSPAGCTATASTTVYVMPTTITINGPTNVVCGNTYTYTATPSIPFPPAIYSWTGINTNPATGLGNSSNIQITGSPAIITWELLYNDNGPNHCKTVHTDTVTCTAPPSIGKKEAEKNSGISVKKLSVYPNPARTQLNIELSLEKNEKDNICIYNSLGLQVECMELTNDLTTIDIYNLSAGIYFYRITDEGGNLLANDKLMIIK